MPEPDIEDVEALRKTVVIMSTWGLGICEGHSCNFFMYANIQTDRCNLQMPKSSQLDDAWDHEAIKGAWAVEVRYC